MRPKLLLLSLLLLTAPCSANSSSYRLLYIGLDPQSISQHLAFYELYPNTSEGKAALQRAWALLSGGEPTKGIECAIPEINLERLGHMVDLLAKQRLEKGGLPTQHEIEAIDLISRSRLTHLSLKGHQVWTEEEVVALPEEEIDLARGLFASLCLGRETIRAYEALIDLMALQILTRVSVTSPPAQKIREINRFLFEEKGVRFPPHALFAKEIDYYTFLPSVLDGQRGVCLGVSSLYLCIAQRLLLELEVITPPGHIYVRYRDERQVINIETTMRGVNLPSSEYLAVQTRSLQRRTVKEVIGLTFMNQAAALWEAGKHNEALLAYERSQLYLPNDPLVKEFLAYNYLTVGRKEEGISLLTEIRDVLPDHLVSCSSVADDLLADRVDVKGVNAIFGQVDETRESILEKQRELVAILDQWPKFRAGWFHLATTHLQLGHTSAAIAALEEIHQLDPTDEAVEYYLAALSMERYNFPKAWDHLHQAEALVARRHHAPRALRELRRELRLHAPE